MITVFQDVMFQRNLLPLSQGYKNMKVAPSSPNIGTYISDNMAPHSIIILTLSAVSTSNLIHLKSLLKNLESLEKIMA